LKVIKGTIRKVFKMVLYGLYFFLVSFILLEIFLRIYDPFKFRIKANRLILPVNQTETIINRINPKLDSVIIVTRNALGFRGPDTPANFAAQLSIIAVGGSTTECHFLSDHKDWPYLVGKKLENNFTNVWMNNAGIDGQSTFGHQLLLNDYIKQIRPKIVLFLTGVNDMENEGPSFFDLQKEKNAYPDLRHFLYNNSEVINAIVNLARGARAQRFNNTSQKMKLPGALGILHISEKEREKRLSRQQKYLDGYGARISALIDTCKRYDMLPVFITQPCLSGYAIDSVTGVNLATAKVEDRLNGALLFDLLELYNNKIRNVCSDKAVPCIDLAAFMPKNSLYFYDQTHFTNKGAAMVANVVAEKMRGILKGRY
jgi:hypothetical protein